MSKRVSPQLSENGAGKYIVSIGLTFTEVTEIRSALSVAIGDNRKKVKDHARSAEDHKLYAYRAEVLSHVLSYLLEAHTILKDASNSRQEGRWLKKIGGMTS